MRTNKKLLMRQLTWTILLLGIAMLALWLLFYAYMHRVFRSYVMDNMEQVSSSIISELNQSFLQLEEVTYLLSDNEEVAGFLTMEQGVDFYSRAFSIGKIVMPYVDDTVFVNDMIVYNRQRRYYRFLGNISNTGIHRMMDAVEGAGDNTYIRVSIDEKNYIGYIGRIYEKDTEIGKVVMLTDEKNIYRLFEELTENENVDIALAADGNIIASSKEDLVLKDVPSVVRSNEYSTRKKVGFTPFELLVTYENTDQTMDYLFLAAMAVMTIILVFIFRLFIDFWKKKFFVPIQGVISEVESFQGSVGEGDNPLGDTATKREKILPLTGMEHIDGLVRGINDMVQRIEQQEKDVFDAAYQLQEAEIEKQKALIVSLKKQISAHFTVNVLNSISALFMNGENEKAGLLCDGLSYLLRYANAGDSFINGMEELFVLQKYIEIMTIRYPNRFHAEIDFEDYLEDVKLPRMLLQPIVENSIVHGFSGLEEGQKGTIHIYTEQKGEEIHFIVEDDGCGMTDKQLTRLQNEMDEMEDEIDMSEGLTHVALKNIQRRIRSYYGEGYGIRLMSKEGKGMKVYIILPAREK